jgi:predicted  nucleic acid-binding Zn-ribbon protein
MIEGFDIKSAGFLFAVFAFFAGILGTAMRWLFGRAIRDLDGKFEEIDHRMDQQDSRFEKLEAVIEKGAESRNAMVTQMARIEERLKVIPSHTQFADLAKEVGIIKASQTASAHQLNLIAEHILKQEARGKCQSSVKT